MNNRVIYLKSFTDIESLKRFILQKLNLIDHKKESVTEFDDRLKSYINRNEDLKIIFQFDRNNLENDLKFKLSLTNRVDQPYPDNFELGNPHNRWFFDPIIKTEEEIEREKVQFEKGFQKELVTLKEFLDKLEQLGNGQICIKDS